MSNEYNDRFKISVEERSHIAYLTTYFDQLQKSELFQESEWDLSSTRNMKRIASDPNNNNHFTNMGWVIGSKYDKRQYPEDYELFKQSEFGAILRHLITTNSIQSARIKFVGSVENQQKEGLLLVSMKVNLVSGGTILIDIANSSKEKDQENVMIRAFGAKSPLRSGMVELDQNHDMNNFPLRYMFQKNSDKVE